MRRMLFLFCLTTLAIPLQAQVQQRKLIDRLLEPDLSLVNSAQGKKFSGTEVNLAKTEFATRSFYFCNETTSRERLSGLKNFTTRSFDTRPISRVEVAVAETVTATSASTRTFETKPSPLARPAPEATKSAGVRNYPDQRSFGEKGTRQEILSHQGRPLTIEEVRELLNKND